MKKSILILLSLTLPASWMSAGTSLTPPAITKPRPANNGSCFDEKTHLINLGVGIGGAGVFRSIGGGYVYSGSPLFTLSYEQAYPKKLGPGYLGVGALLGYRTAHSRYENFNNSPYFYEHRWNHFTVATRGVYHWDVLNAKNAEVYGGVLLGVRITTYDFRSHGDDPDSRIYARGDGGVGVVAGLFAGARWYFLPGMSLFGETGAGANLPYLNGGISFKF